MRKEMNKEGKMEKNSSPENVGLVPRATSVGVRNN